ncbi:MAG: helix-turn-helix domain-containing protein [Lachnospiraceae bacterium]|nr:helix-turn-helix domain-containing protein [Lachnospiraceae bacterium]
MNHLTQEKMAELLYIDTQYYAQLERGLRNFTIDKIVAICYIFHIGIDKIIEIETSSPDKKETEQLQKKIHRKLDSLSYTQLVLTDRFISEVLPCVNQ